MADDGSKILLSRILKPAIRNRLAEAAGVEPARALRGDLANRCHTVRRRLPTRNLDLRIWRTQQIIRILKSAICIRLAEGYGVEPYTVINRRSFQDCLTLSTVGPSLICNSVTEPGAVATGF